MSFRLATLATLAALVTVPALAEDVTVIRRIPPRWSAAR